ncbi:MAG: Mut7-C RNAse domain-containing protein [Acidobacteriota bacterium]
MAENSRSLNAGRGKNAEVTRFLDGKVQVLQPRKGYRFNVDSVVLAGCAWVRDEESVLDLGTGAGILLLLLGFRHHPAVMAGVEIQDSLASLARLNLVENGWDETASIIHGDFRDPELLAGRRFDVVVSNPPYFDPRRGRSSPDSQKALSRQGVACSVLELAAAAARALAPGGRFVFLCPAERLGEVRKGLEGAGLYPRLVRAVRHTPGSPPYILVIQARRNHGKGCLYLPDLFLKGPAGSDTPEMASVLHGDRGPGPNFFCDCMVGRLAHYLRLLGYDAAYARQSDDEWILCEALRAKRVLLTRDRLLVRQYRKAGGEAFNPDADRPASQLRLVREKFGPAPAPGAPRCLNCNAPTTAVKREMVRGFVPPYTYLTHRRFQVCPCCGKVTWEGSHLARFAGNVIGESNNEPGT